MAATLTGGATPAADVPAPTDTAAAAQPSPTDDQPDPPPANDDSGDVPTSITISWTTFTCDAYAFEVESRPGALERVHWTSRAPAEPDNSGSVAVSDAEVSQSPGVHSFTYDEQEWTQPGSNRLEIRGESADGVVASESRDIQC
jgi:hypothetical protein